MICGSMRQPLHHRPSSLSSVVITAKRARERKIYYDIRYACVCECSVMHVACVFTFSSALGQPFYYYIA